MRSARAARALAHLGEADPGLALLALWVEHVDGDGPTRSSAARIVYGPGFDTLPLPEQVGIVAHHVLHVALRHVPRQAALARRLGDGRASPLFNLAADALVNEVVLAGGHALPRPAATLGPLVHATFGAEAAADPAVWDAETLTRALMESDAVAGRAAEHGTRKGFAPDLATGDGDDGGGDGTDPQAAEWQGRLARAAEAGRQAGRGAGALLARLGDGASPCVPWEHRLRRLATPALDPEPRRTWRRPSNAWIARTALAEAEGRPAPVFEPGRARDRCRPRIAVALDTSSSIGDGDLARFAAEAAAIAARTGAETHLIGFDEAVHTQIEIAPGTLAARLGELEMRRGGGTRFPPALTAAAALSPSIIVVLSDLDGPAGPPPGPPVIWAVPRAGAAAPFGQIIDLSA